MYGFNIDRGLSFSFAGKFRDLKGRYAKAPGVTGYKSKNRIKTGCTTQGLNAAIAVFRGLPFAYTEGLYKAYWRIAAKVQSISDHYVPTDTGKLRASGGYRTKKQQLPTVGNSEINVAIEMQYGGSSAPYAIYVHEDPTKRHGAAYLAHQAAKQMDKMHKYDARFGRLHKESLAKYTRIRANEHDEKADSHRPQEQYKWTEVAWQQARPYIEAQLQSAVRGVINKLKADAKKEQNSIVVGPYLRGLKRAGILTDKGRVAALSKVTGGVK